MGWQVIPMQQRFSVQRDKSRSFTVVEGQLSTG